MYSDKYGEIGNNHFHYGVLVDDKIYDNFSLSGMDFKDWLKDLGYYDGYVKYKILE